MQVQHLFGMMTKCQRIAYDLDDAMYSVIKAAPTLAVDEYNNERPYITQLSVLPVAIEDMLYGDMSPSFEVNIFIFDTQEEKDKFLNDNPNLKE